MENYLQVSKLQLLPLQCRLVGLIYLHFLAYCILFPFMFYVKSTNICQQIAQAKVRWSTIVKFWKQILFPVQTIVNSFAKAVLPWKRERPSKTILPNSRRANIWLHSVCDRMMVGCYNVLRLLLPQRLFLFLWLCRLGSCFIFFFFWGTPCLWEIMTLITANDN